MRKFSKFNILYEFSDNQCNDYQSNTIEIQKSYTSYVRLYIILRKLFNTFLKKQFKILINYGRFFPAGNFLRLPIYIAK